MARKKTKLSVEEEIFEEGVEAALLGLTLDNNPYYPETERFNLWDKGWLLGIAEREVNRRLYNEY